MIALTSSSAAALTPAATAAAASPPVILTLALATLALSESARTAVLPAKRGGPTRLPHARLRGGDVTRGLVLLLVGHLRR